METKGVPMTPASERAIELATEVYHRVVDTECHHDTMRPTCRKCIIQYISEFIDSFAQEQVNEALEEAARLAVKDFTPHSPLHVGLQIRRLKTKGGTP